VRTIMAGAPPRNAGMAPKLRDVYYPADLQAAEARDAYPANTASSGVTRGVGDDMERRRKRRERTGCGPGVPTVMIRTVVGEGANPAGPRMQAPGPLIEIGR